MAMKKKVKVKVKAKKKVKAKSKKSTLKKGKGKAKKALELNLEKVGEVTHYFPHVKAAAVMVLKGGINVGDSVYIKGHTTDFKEKVNSIQLDHVAIQAAKLGQEIGLLVKSRVRIGDSVYRL